MTRQGSPLLTKPKTFPKTRFKTPESIPTCTAEVREAVSLECSIARRLHFVLREIYLCSSMSSSHPHFLFCLLSNFSGIQCIIQDIQIHTRAAVSIPRPSIFPKQQSLSYAVLHKMEMNCTSSDAKEASSYLFALAIR